MVHIAHMVPLVHIAGLYHVHQPNHCWGKPERAPHRLVVDVGGTSVACMPDNLHYIYTVVVGGTSVVCPTIYTTYTVFG